MRMNRTIALDPWGNGLAVLMALFGMKVMDGLVPMMTSLCAGPCQCCRRLWKKERLRNY